MVMDKENDSLKQARRQEIIEACALLYKTMSFKDITIKEIGKVTSFTRTSIYNYFQTKEEIFLALLKQEYELLNIDIEKLYNSNDFLTVEDFSKKLSEIFSKRHILLKTLSKNHYDMESRSRVDNIADFKVSYGRTLQLVSDCLKKYFNKMSSSDIDNFIYVFFPFLFGVYPYTNVTDKQKQAMEKAELEYKEYTAYEIIRECIYNLLRIYK